MRHGRPEAKDLFAHSSRLCRLAWPKAAPIHHLPVRLFGEQRHAADRARSFENVMHLSRGSSSTSDPHFLAGNRAVSSCDYHQRGAADAS
jgi:hypothetical protein